MPNRLIAHFLSLTLFALTCQSENVHDDSGALFDSSDDVMADINETLERARKADKLALIVVGANWCHDSRALAARLHEEPLHSVADERFETVFVDVGFFTDGYDVLERFGSPIFYATPTVLLVDPATEQVVNATDRHMWGNADSISMEDSVEYFSRYSSDIEYASSAGPFPEIDAYEAALAERVRAGYTNLGPMLRAHKGGRSPPDFEEKWTELAKFRNAIPEAVIALRAQAQAQVAAGQEVELDFPEFPETGEFSWE